MIQQRLSLSSMIAAATAVVALGLPGMASAAYEHPANNEKGVIVHPGTLQEREDARAGHRGSQGCHAARTSFLWREQLPNACA